MAENLPLREPVPNSLVLPANFTQLTLTGVRLDESSPESREGRLITLSFTTEQMPGQVVSLVLEPEVARHFGETLIQRAGSPTKLGADLHQAIEKHRESGEKPLSNDEILAELADRRS